MNEERFQQIERLIEDAGRCFDPATGLFESIGDEEDITTDLEPRTFLGLLGITEDECAEYVQRKTHDYDDSFRNA
jgi:hypothetical protein